MRSMHYVHQCMPPSSLRCSLGQHVLWVRRGSLEQRRRPHLLAPLVPHPSRRRAVAASRVVVVEQPAADAVAAVRAGCNARLAALAGADTTSREGTARTHVTEPWMPEDYGPGFAVAVHLTGASSGASSMRATRRGAHASGPTRGNAHGDCVLPNRVELRDMGLALVAVACHTRPTHDSDIFFVAGSPRLQVAGRNRQGWARLSAPQSV